MILSIDVDETLSTWKEILQRYGYAPEGEIAVRMQFQINGQHYSSICAYSAIGFLAYRVVQGFINARTSKSFLKEEESEVVLSIYLKLRSYSTFSIRCVSIPL